MKNNMYDEIQIIEDYNSSMKIEKIKEKHNIKSVKTIYDIIKRNGREHLIANKKYQVNQNYFEKIDTEEKAYWLGFLYADGNVRIHKGRSGQLKLKLKQSDRQHIEKFNECLNSNYPIKDGIDIVKTKGKEHKCPFSVVNIYNTKLVKDLMKMGCVENKTFKLKFPEFLDREFIRHFIRGYFDGDGCITVYSKTNLKGRVNFVSASYSFLSLFNNIMINSINLTNNKIANHKTYYTLNWNGLTDVENIYFYLYTAASIYLCRKKKKFDEILIYNQSKIKYRKKINNYYFSF